MQKTETSSYRWLIIFLCGLTSMSVIAIPTMSLSVLFDEIATDLGLSLFQVGLIWGTASFTSMFLSLAGGMLGDRFGSKQVIVVACLGIGLIGATRGAASGFASFLLSSLVMGFFTPFMGVNLHNVAAQWFEKEELGLANGIISSGFALGFLLGTMLAANVLSPAFGSWRPIFYLYGAISVIVAILWWIIHPNETENAENEQRERVSLREGLPQVLRIRGVLLIGIGKLGVWGCVRGVTGYLPLYLRDTGWEPSMADAALSAFFVVSLLGAIPIPIISDRWGSRKPFIVLSAVLIGAGSLMLGFVDGWVVFVATVIAGVMFDAFMGLSITLVSEVKGLSRSLAGTSIGVTFLFADIGGTISPPLGNALASISPELPFYLWGGMALVAIFAFTAVRE